MRESHRVSTQLRDAATCADVRRPLLRHLPVLALTIVAPVFAQEPKEEGVELLRSDSRAPFVHRIGLYDERGGAIDPADPDAAPYSPRATCGKCHEVGAIGRGWHFNAGHAEVPSGRPGEPWIYADPSTGTQIPLSYRGWRGTFSPDAVGLTPWDVMKIFGRHLPGGGALHPPETADPPGLSRWPLAGGLDIDCMLCHSKGNHHDPAQRAAQIERENLRWIPTVAAGFAVVRGDVAKLPDDFDPDLGPNPDFPEQQLPRLTYDRTRFDADDRVLFDITRRPATDRCYFCHSTREVGDGAPRTWHTDDDVHLRAGMTCTDCHRNGIDHMIVRGYEGERDADGRLVAAGTLTCRGCHTDDAAADELPPGEYVPKAGRLGAPIPRHAGLPAFHLEEMSCTACHSGPEPGSLARRFQTSLSHGLGLPTRDRRTDDDPVLTGPVFLPGADGRLAPHRLAWPQYWSLSREAGFPPLDAARVKKLLKNPLADAQRSATTQGPLTREQITAGLKALQTAAAESESPAYVAFQRVYTLGPDGSLVSTSDEAGAAYAWPIAHDVRPARQSLGAGGCTDCHADDAPMYAGRIVDASLAANPDAPRTTMQELRGADVGLARAWNRSMRLREAFKVAAFAAVALVAWFAVARGTGACARWIERR
ncbi:MAG: hypothetical protein KJ057_09960 [Phycisphaerae bacterium]|nr:MAG: hypothetical protein EDS66_15440 [Planctomycetota bacterium]KAB2942427.1 MAG: hypothetical protein F9K17_12400 [Phycisphaerae bacterium]MBE7458409.1 hypothetical protein [Planctomycetia bacterium]MCK6465222.1 hypothetical protein [Phycisphaerae bacterium]MCL4718782.1 hypothetical protein [Phycisphaerae bacterium]